MDHLSTTKLRIDAYKIFSKLLDYPYDDDVPRLAGMIQELMGILEGLEGGPGYSAALKYLAKAKDTLLKELEKMGRDEFQAAYVSTFELGMPRPPCPPFESVYREPGELEGPVFIEAPGSQASPSYMELKGTLDVLASLTTLYEESGVIVRKTSPDHISVELEFAAYLLEKSIAGPEEDSMFRYAFFLERHLAAWIPRFAGCLARKSKLRTYHYLAEALSAYIRAELEALERTQEK